MLLLYEIEICDNACFLRAYRHTRVPYAHALVRVRSHVKGSAFGLSLFISSFFFKGCGGAFLFSSFFLFPLLGETSVRILVRIPDRKTDRIPDSFFAILLFLDCKLKHRFCGNIYNEMVNMALVRNIKRFQSCCRSLTNANR